MASEAEIGLKPRLQILLRCFLCNCPRCNYRPLAGITFFKNECPGCGLVLDRKNGFLLAALPNAYFIYAVFFLVPLLVIWAQGHLSYLMAFGLLLTSAVAVPVLLYNYCKMIALAQYYIFLPGELYKQAD